ncbi:methylmalonyl-CoA mutase family protein [Methylobacillus flagellatus]|uniref:methylmalonyl-CoA mutase family protein n=1 Tax=Methylobacillus flagellatus TaxID=405 RepID=UPI0010F851FC|nr:methylmalonyl-CoA mutase family protein [Methylobacillus flagellatus]
MASRPKALYTQEDIAGLPHLYSLPGAAPFLRGPYASMYTERPWTIRQYAGMASADDSNRMYRNALASGAQGLSIAFDLPTHRGYDSDHAMAGADVGMAGVAIDSVEDMKRLLANIPLDQVSVSMTMNGAVLPVLAAFIVAAEEAGVPAEALSGTIQNDILKEFIVRNTYIFAPAPSLRIAADVVEFLAQKVPRFNAMSVSGYHFQEGGADPVLALALTLANARTYAELLQQRGMAIDQVCAQLSFFFGVGSDFYQEIAKLRAARVLWCEIAESLGASTNKARALRMHCQTSGWSLTAQDTQNNIVRTTLQALAAVFGGTQSLHTNAYDEALSLPTETSSCLARNTQLILQLETGVCDVIDPWAGSYMMESMTADIVTRVRLILQQIAAQGGMVAAIENGWAERQLRSAAAATQAQIELGAKAIVGLNKHVHVTATETPTHASALNGPVHPIPLNREVQPASLEQSLQLDHQRILAGQQESLRSLKQQRDELAVRRALRRLEAAARHSDMNLLEATMLAIRARATVGECTAALAAVWPYHSVQPEPAQPVFGAAMQEDAEWQRACFRVDALRRTWRRAPRVLIVKLGQDGHDRGAKLLAGALADAGFDVELSPLFQSPVAVVAHTAQTLPDVIGVSSLAGSHMQFIPALLTGLTERGLAVPVIAGGVIPPSHAQYLKTLGVIEVFGPGMRMYEAVHVLCRQLEKSLL